MKRWTLILAAMTMAACASREPLPPAPAAPAPGRCQLPLEQEKGVYVSLVRSASQDESLRIALGNIANQLQMVVRSESESISSKQGNTSVQTFQRRITSASEFVFDDYEILCQDFVTHEVLVQYDDRPLDERILSSLQRAHGSTGWVLSGDPAVIASPALTPLQQSAGTGPVTLKAGITRDSKGWRLALGSHQFRLRNEEWRQLFRLPPSSRPSVSLGITDEFGKPLPASLRHDQEFRFLIQGTLPDAFYLSIFYLDAAGKITEVRANEIRHRAESIAIPGQGIFSAELPEGFESIIDDYVVILSGKPLDRPASQWLFNGWQNLFSGSDAYGIRLTVR